MLIKLITPELISGSLPLVLLSRLSFDIVWWGLAGLQWYIFISECR